MEIQQDPPPFLSLPPSHHSFTYNHMKKLDTSKLTYITINAKTLSCVDDDGHFCQNQNLRHGQ